MNKESFIENAQEIMQIGLNTNIIDSFNSSQLRSLIADPEKLVTGRFLNSKEIMDSRYQKRKLDEFRSTNEYLNLIKFISACKNKRDWKSYVDNLEISRAGNKFKVCLPPWIN
jgi:hypothetical protein